MQVVILLISANQENAAKVLLEVVSAIKTFDLMHENNKDYNDKAVLECTPLSFWLHVTVKESLDDIFKKIKNQNQNNTGISQKISINFNNDAEELQKPS